MKQNGIQHAPEVETFVIKQAPQKFVGLQMFCVLFMLTKSSFQLCQKPSCFAASAQNLCLFLLSALDINNNSCIRQVYHDP